MNAIDSKVCGRCGGSGEYSFNQMDGTRCYGCGGVGRIPKTPKGQKKIKPTAELKDAQVGDIISYRKVLYRVERVTWTKPRREGWFTYNQAVHVVRLVDGATFAIRRECMQELGGSVGYSLKDGVYHISFGGAPYTPTPEEIGQETTALHVRMSQEDEAAAIAWFLGNHPEITPEQIKLRER